MNEQIRRWRRWLAPGLGINALLAFGLVAGEGLGFPEAMGIIVTDLNGGRIDPGKAALRWVGKIISCIILFIGYIMAAFTERKQALHDMIAGTLVLKGKR